LYLIKNQLSGIIGIVFILYYSDKFQFMSQNSGNKKDERQADGGRGMGEHYEHKQYEGFEGMNYEQRRQPYNTKPINRERDGGNNSGGGGNRQEDL
jgi:hypothetical protein